MKYKKNVKHDRIHFYNIKGRLAIQVILGEPSCHLVNFSQWNHLLF